MFPIEILTAIATELNAAELSSFRLASRTFAIAGAPILPKNGLSVMNSSNDIQALQSLLKCASIANNVKTLRLYHVEWPLCIAKEWETHAVLFRSNSRLQTKSTNYEIRAYEDFKIDQNSRRHSDDALTNLMKRLCNLETIVVSSLQDCFWSHNSNSRYQRLRKTVWVLPYRSREVSGAFQQLFSASGISQRTKNLQVFGCFDPSILHLNKSSTNFSWIQKLTVQGFKISDNDESIRQFLDRFRNLKELSISFHGWGPVAVLGSLQWPYLEEVSLHGVWTAEKEFYSLFKNHSTTLQRFDINSSSLTQGSWENLFTKMRDLGSQAAVSASGELYGRTARETLNMDCEHAVNLERFMVDSSVDWPFLRV